MLNSSSASQLSFPGTCTFKRICLSVHQNQMSLAIESNTGVFPPNLLIHDQLFVLSMYTMTCMCVMYLRNICKVSRQALALIY